MGFFRGNSQSFPRTILSCLAVSAFLFLSGCGQSPLSVKKSSSSSTAATLNCELSQDQVGTFLGRWAVTPLPVALQAGNWGSGDAGRIFTAADTWNQFYNTSRGFPLINIGTVDSLVTSSANQPSEAVICTESLISGNTYSGQVVIYKENTSWAHDKDVIALTTTCSITDSPFSKNYMGVMEVNYMDFFKAGTRQPDLQSIMLHEFGHLMGLNHSCEFGGDTGVPACESKSISKDYLSAVMYPQVTFNPVTKAGEVRRVLQKNDQGRANCLYDPVK